MHAYEHRLLSVNGITLSLYSAGPAESHVGTLEAHTLQKMPGWVPDLEQHLLGGCGHWVQSRRSEQVNRLLLNFLGHRYSEMCL